MAATYNRRVSSTTQKRYVEPDDSDLENEAKRIELARQAREAEKANDPLSLLEQQLQAQRESFQRAQEEQARGFATEQARLASEAQSKLATQQKQWEETQAKTATENEARRKAFEEEASAKVLFIEQQRKKLEGDRVEREALALKKEQDNKASVLTSGQNSLGDRQRQEGFIRELVSKEDIKATQKEDEEFKKQDKKTFLERVRGRRG